MKISLLSVFPDLYTSFLNTSLLRHARDEGIVSVQCESFFSYVAPKERIDAPTCGTGAGMLIRPDVVESAIADREQAWGNSVKVFFSPHGKKITQTVLAGLAQKIAKKGHLICVAGRYEGMDARVEQEYADEILSIGDYVLMGGDLPAMVFLEGLLRLIPGVVGKKDSVTSDSFQGPFVDYPEYTKPVIWRDRSVPDVVLSGNHGALAAWRKQQAVERTVMEHFDWLRTQTVTNEEKQLIRETIPPHYVALLHGDVLVGPERVHGTTSVTSIDIHDIARTSATYGINQFFIVTPLLDQERIVNTLVDFWKTGVGIRYNPIRHKAINRVQIQSSFADVVAWITEKEGVAPIVLATSAKHSEHEGSIDFYDQGRVWQYKRPVLIIFGTGQGISDEVISASDYLLPPVCGFSDYNHLSVRSAAAIVLDRWLGSQVKKS